MLGETRAESGTRELLNKSVIVQVTEMGAKQIHIVVIVPYRQAPTLPSVERAVSDVPNEIQYRAILQEKSASASKKHFHCIFVDQPLCVMVLTCWSRSG